MFDGVDSPLTQTFGLGMFEPAEGSVLSGIEEFFRARKAPVQHEVCPLAGVALGRSLAERGYVPYEMATVLFMDLAELPARRVDGDLTIRLAVERDADVYARTAAQGWNESGEVMQMIADMSRIMFAARGYVGFLVEKAETVIATGGLIVHDGVALLAGASTVAEARGQGAQRALLRARLDHAAQVGCDLAMMVTEPGSGSQRNAERSGFRIGYTRTKWRLDW